MLVRTGFFDNEVDRFGTTISLSSITNASYSDWGDATETTSDSSVTAVVNVLNQEDDLVKEGTFQTGDKVFFVKSDETVNRGDIITHDSKTYEVFEVIDHELGGTDFVQEIRTHKV